MNPQIGSRQISSALFVSIILISFSAIFVKWSDAPATVLSMYRMWFAGLMLLPIIWRKRREFKKLKMKDWYLFGFSGLFLALHFGLWFESLKLTTVASSTVILALQPIVSLAGGFILYKERTVPSALLAMGAAIGGAMMIGWGDFALSSRAIMGDAFSFLCVISVVCYLLIGQSLVKKVSHWLYSFSVFIFAAIFLTLYNLTAHIELEHYEAREWGIFLLLAVIPTLAHLIFNWLMNYVNSTAISMSVLGEPVGATALAIFLLGEQVTGWQITGGCIVLTGVFLFLIQQRKRRLSLIKKSA